VFAQLPPSLEVTETRYSSPAVVSWRKGVTAPTKSSITLPVYLRRCMRHTFWMAAAATPCLEYLRRAR
jgi:hypothetical protein